MEGKFNSIFIRLLRHEEPELFVGRTDGKIVAPRGPAKGDYDFDVIFEPAEGERHTYAEMGLGLSLDNQ